MNKKITRVNIGCFVCAFLLLVLLVLQFVPFWHYEGGASSISTYLWFPNKNVAVTSSIKAVLGKTFEVGQIVIGCIAVLASSVLGLVTCIIGQKSIGAPFTAILAGVIGVGAYLAVPALQLGSFWGVHLAVSILIVATGAVTFWWKKNTP